MEENTKENQLSLWARIVKWWYDHFYDQYEVTVWFCKETTINEHGLKSVTRSEPKTFLMHEVYKHSQTHIKGKDINGNPLEIKTSEPFDYNIKKIN